LQGKLLPPQVVPLPQEGGKKIRWIAGSGINNNPSVTQACHLPLHKGGYGRRKPLPYGVDVSKPCCSNRAVGDVSPYVCRLTCRDETNSPSVTHACHLPQEGGKAGRRGAVPYVIKLVTIGGPSGMPVPTE